MGTTFKLLLGRVRFRWLLAPLGALLLIGTALLAGFVSPPRILLENLTIFVLGVCCSVCLVRLAVQREIFFSWAAGLLGCLLMREFHFAGPSGAVYLGLVLLLLLALRYFTALESYLGSPRLLTLLAVGFFTYALSVTLDQRWWRPFPGEETIHTPLEESMELLGHLLIGLSLVFARRMPAKGPQTG